MFLMKKSFRKIVFMMVSYAVVGLFCFAAFAVCMSLGAAETVLLILGAVCFALSALLFFWGRYAEGKAPLMNLGNKLIRTELNPAAFIQEYERIKNADDVVVAKPDTDVLQLVLLAYDLLDDKERVWATVEEMITVANEKKKSRMKLLKAAVLFSWGELEEAERLFNEAREQKMDMTGRVITDIVFRSDRAKAIGDYKTAELYYRERLEQTFPKPDNCAKLTSHYALAEIYEKWQENEKARQHYQYCAEHGGQTALQKSAAERLQRIGS